MTTMADRISDEIKAEIVVLREAGTLRRSIAEKLGISLSAVDYWLNPEQTRLARRKWQRKWRQENAAAHLLDQACHRAKVKGLEFTLTIQDIIIPDRCPYLDIPLLKHEISLVADRVEKLGPHPQAPTLDRIDPAKGYTPENVIVVSHKANAMKQDMSPQDIVNFGRRMEYLLRTDPRFQIGEGIV